MYAQARLRVTVIKGILCKVYMTTSIYELIDKALDHLYTVNNVLPDTVDDEVIEELGNAIEVCEKIYKEFKPMERNQ